MEAALKSAPSIEDRNGAPAAQPSLIAVANSDNTSPIASPVFELKALEKTARKPEQIERIKRDIARIAKAFANNHHIDVLPSSEQSWSCRLPPEGQKVIDEFLSGKRENLQDVPFFSMRPRQVFYPISDLESRPENEIVALLRHHVARALKSDQGCFFEGQRLAQSQGFLPSTWMTLHDALESSWIDTRLMKESDLVKSQMMELYKKSSSQLESECSQGSAVVQLARGIRYYWLNGNLPQALRGTEIGRIFESIKPEVDAYLAGSSSQANFALLRDSIWPKVKELEHVAATSQAIEQLGREIAAGKMKLDAPEIKEPAPSPVPQVVAEPPTPTPPSPSNPFHEYSPPKRSIWHTPVSEIFGWQAIKKVVKKLRRRSPEEKLRDEFRKLDAKKERLEQRSSETRRPEPSLADLQAATQKKLETTYKNLPDTERKRLEEQGRAVLESTQLSHLKREGNSLTLEKNAPSGPYHLASTHYISDAHIEALRSAINSYSDELKRRNEEVRPPPEETGVRLRKLTEQILKQEMRRNGFDDNEQGLFTEFMAMESALRGYTKRFVDDFAGLLPKGKTLKHIKSFETGSKLNFDKLVDEIHSPGRGDIFERQTVVPSEEHEITIWLLIDHSPSMKDNNKMTEALKATVFWARVLSDLEIPLSVKFFAGSVTNVLGVQDDYDDPRNKAKAKIMKEGNTFPYSTDIGTPLELALAESRALPRPQHGKRRACAVFVISDSGANTGRQGPVLRELIEGMQKEVLVENFLLNGDKNEVEQAKLYFGEDHVIVANQFEEFPRIAIDRLRKVLYQFARQIVRNGE